MFTQDSTAFSGEYAAQLLAETMLLLQRAQDHFDAALDSELNASDVQLCRAALSFILCASTVIHLLYYMLGKDPTGSAESAVVKGSERLQ